MDLAETGVTANVVSPGSTRTPILEASARLYGLDSVEAFVDQQPIGRLLEPSEPAAMIAWLCSAHSSAVTGAVFAVDGGMTVH
jgi:NAD(P)-dependent dehydrogenase (short-subunit alcohol dehydrogenase family)